MVVERAEKLREGDIVTKKCELRAYFSHDLEGLLWHMDTNSSEYHSSGVSWATTGSPYALELLFEWER
jgi:hypothetical protein